MSATEVEREEVDQLSKRLRGTPLYEGSGEQSDLPEQVADQVDRMLLELDDWREMWRAERALRRAGWTHAEGATDCRPPIGKAPDFDRQPVRATGALTQTERADAEFADDPLGDGGAV